MEGINLLPTKSKVEFEKLKKAKVVKAVAFWVVLSLVVVSSGVLGARIIILRQIKKEKERIQILNSQFLNLSPKVAEQQWIRFKVKTAAEILESRRSYSEMLQNVLVLLDNNFEAIRKISVGGDSLKLDGSLPDSAALEKLEKKVEDKDFIRASGFESIILERLGRGSQGEWGFSLKIKFVEEKG